MAIVRRILIGALALALATACGSKSGGGGDGDKPKVDVSIFPLYDLVRRVGGDRLDVQLVLQPGKTEHAYDPTPKEMARLQNAKLGITVGLDMDTWAEQVMQGTKVVHVGDVVKTMPIAVEPIGEDEAHGSGEKDADDKPGAPDPHVWMDPLRMVDAVDTIAKELTALDPKGKDAYAKNADAVKASLRALDGKIAARAKAWSKHVIVTFHGSMSYYAKRYGVTIAAVVEPLAGKEPTAKYITEVLDAIKRGKASALFTEPQFDPAPGKTIADQADIPLGELDPVGGVAGRDSYEKLLEWNTDQLEKALK
jgi:zinc transport system substrate-binding protein